MPVKTYITVALENLDSEGLDQQARQAAAIWFRLERVGQEGHGDY